MKLSTNLTSVFKTHALVSEFDVKRLSEFLEIIDYVNSQDELGTINGFQPQEFEVCDELWGLVLPKSIRLVNSLGFTNLIARDEYDFKNLPKTTPFKFKELQVYICSRYKKTPNFNHSLGDRSEITVTEDVLANCETPKGIRYDLSAAKVYPLTLTQGLDDWNFTHQAPVAQNRKLEIYLTVWTNSLQKLFSKS